MRRSQNPGARRRGDLDVAARNCTLETASRISPIGSVSPICLPTPDIRYAHRASWLLAPSHCIAPSLREIRLTHSDQIFPRVKEKIILSTVSAWELGDRFQSTQAQKNDALREAKVAKQDGDLSENAPYQAAKEKFRTMGRIQRRLTREMDQLLEEGHRLVDPLTWVNDNLPEEVELGTVVVIDLDGEREKFLVAGARDHHTPSEGDILPLPYSSPLGHALMGKQENESFTVKIRETVRSVSIYSIRRPTRDEILGIFPALKEG